MWRALVMYVITVGDTISQFLNAWIFWSQAPNQSLSGRSWESRDHWFWGAMQRFIDWVAFAISRDTSHCYKSYRNDRIRGAEAAGIPEPRFLEMIKEGELPPWDL